MRNNVLTALAVTGAIGAGLAQPASADEIVTEILPSQTTGAWYQFVEGNGTASTTSLTGLGGNLETNAPLPTGSALLTTGAANADRGEMVLEDDFGTFGAFLNGGSLGYNFFKDSTGDLNAFAAAAMKIAVFDTNTSQADAFTTFVFEPTWNQSPANTSQAVPTDVWHDESIDAANGLFWHTGLYDQPSIAAGGADLQRTLGDWATVFGDDILDASILAVSIGVGTFNQGQTNYVDNVRVNAGSVDETFDFEAPVPLPGTLALLVSALLGLGAAGRFRHLVS